MHDELIKWALGAAGSAVMFVGGLVVYLVRIAYGIGQSAKAIEAKLEKLHDIEKKAEQVPLIRTELDTLADAMTEHRRKTDSDFRELRRSVYGRSSPGLNGLGEE